MAPALRKLLQRVIHTSLVCSYTQAFRTRHTHFPLFVCQRRLRAIVFMFIENSSFTKWTATHTHIGRHITQQQHAIVESTRVVKALHQSFSADCSSTQAFRTRHTHFSLFVCQRRLQATVFMFMDNSSFTNWTATHTHWQAYNSATTCNSRIDTGRKSISRIVRIDRFVGTAVRQYYLMRCIFLIDRSCLRVVNAEK